MRIPPFLEPGDAVAIVATARKVMREELQPAIAFLKKCTFVPVIGSSIGLENNQFAGTDEERAKDVQNQLDDPKIKAIWCARGGYGTVRIVDRLDFSAFQKKPKWIVGYSDVTVLHSHLHYLGECSLHAQLAVEVGTKSKTTQDSLYEILRGEKVAYKAPVSPFNRFGKASGQLIGGNLSVLYSLCGSHSALKTAGKILFLEDLDEYLYHIDRMLQNLKRNGLFENLNGLVVGGMTDMNDNRIPFGKTAEEIIAEIVADYNFPVAYNFPAGHLKDNQALVLGREIELLVTENIVTLNYL